MLSLDHRRKHVLRVVTLGALVVVLLFSGVSLRAAGAATDDDAEPPTPTSTPMSTPTSDRACGLDLVVVLDDDSTLVDDVAAAHAFRALQALNSALRDIPSTLTVSDASNIAVMTTESIRPSLVVYLFSGSDQPEPLPSDVLIIDADVDVAALEDTVRATASEPCPMPAPAPAAPMPVAPASPPAVAAPAPVAPAPVAPAPPMVEVSGPRRAVIGDTVWNDRDENATPSPGEPGIQGARVVIENRATGDRQMVTTDATGAYRAAVEPGDYEVTLDMASVDGALTTAEEFEFSVDEGELYLGADFGLDDLYGDGALPFTGSTTTTSVMFGLLVLTAGAVLLGAVHLTRRRA